MTLTQLVDLKKRLEYFTAAKLQSTANNLQQEVSSWSNLATEGLVRQSLDFFIRTFDSIEANSLSIQKLQDDLLELVNQEIQNLSNRYLSLGYEIQGRKVLGPTPNADIDRQFRKIEVSSEFAEQLGSRIRQYTNWKYPCLEIGPGDGFWTDNLVGSDPLYLVDIHKEYLDSTVSKYNHVYKRRIRPYLIGPESGKSDLSLDFLPDNQIGFIFSWAVFNFIPVEQAKIYLKSCFNCLRPGGVMLFSYNDCDTFKGAANAEGGMQSWMTKSLLSNLFEELNFECLGFYNSSDSKNNSNLYYSWVEIKKSGDLYSMKTTQPLISIYLRPGFERVDIQPERIYNQQQIARLKQIAIKMGLDTDENIVTNKYTPHQLEKMINIARMNK